MIACAIKIKYHHFMNWLVYILHCADDTFYTGITNDLDKRLAMHAAGSGAKYTRNRGPFKVVYTEKCDDRSAASKREYAIKALSRDEKIKLTKSS